jgi:hypothetical protein
MDSVHVGPNVEVSMADSTSSHYEVQVCADQSRFGYLMIGAMATRGEGQFVTQIYLSSDDGRSWHLTFEESSVLNSFDPACTYGPKNELFFVTIGFPNGDARTDTFLLRSTDSGQTWRLITMLPRSIDRPFLTTDHSGGPNNGQMYVHGKRDLLSQHFPMRYVEHLWIARTSDGGQTFSQMDVPSSAEQIDVGKAVVMADGSFVTVFGEIRDPDHAFRNAVNVVRLASGSTSISAPIKIADWGVPKHPNATRSFILAEGHGHQLYSAWEDGRFGPTHIMFSRSENRGLTWSYPFDLSSSEIPNGAGFNPSIAVNRSGVIGILWYDKRQHSADLGWSVRFAASLDNGRTFRPSVRVSEKDVIPGPGLGRPGRFSSNGGDTSGLDIEPDDAFRAVWVDNRTGIPQVWTARLVVHPS